MPYLCAQSELLEGASDLPKGAYMSQSASSFDVLGIPISVTTIDQAQNRIVGWSRDTIGRFVCVREVASLMTSINDPNLTALHFDAAMVLPDGMPLVWIGKRRGLPVERTCGPDLMEAVLAASPQTGLKHYLYGGKPGVADILAERFTQKYPGVQIVGTECPPFRPLNCAEIQAVRSRICDSGADVVWVGISSPKQDVWMHDNYRHLTQTLIGVGAAFDFHSGNVKRAPAWMRNKGLEWLHRLVSEPRRLWRRYLVLAPQFVFLVLRDALFGART